MPGTGHSGSSQPLRLPKDPMNASLSTLIPQNDDSVAMLLARLRGTPRSGTLLASAARTTSTSCAEFDAAGYRGILVFLNVSAASGTGGLIVRVEHYDPVTGTWFSGPYVPSAPKTTTGTLLCMFGSGIAVGSNSSVNASLTGYIGAFLNSRMRVSVLASDASSYTYSVGFELIS